MTEERLIARYVALMPALLGATAMLIGTGLSLRRGFAMSPWRPGVVVAVMAGAYGLVFMGAGKPAAASAEHTVHAVLLALSVLCWALLDCVGLLHSRVFVEDEDSVVDSKMAMVFWVTRGFGYLVVLPLAFNTQLGMTLRGSVAPLMAVDAAPALAGWEALSPPVRWLRTPARRCASHAPRWEAATDVLRAGKARYSPWLSTPWLVAVEVRDTSKSANALTSQPIGVVVGSHLVLAAFEPTSAGVSPSGLNPSSIELTGVRRGVAPHVQTLPVLLNPYTESGQRFADGHRLQQCGVRAIRAVVGSTPRAAVGIQEPDVPQLFLFETDCEWTYAAHLASVPRDEVGASGLRFFSVGGRPKATVDSCAPVMDVFSTPPTGRMSVGCLWPPPFPGHCVLSAVGGGSQTSVFNIDGRGILDLVERNAPRPAR